MPPLWLVPIGGTSIGFGSRSPKDPPPGRAGPPGVLQAKDANAMLAKLAERNIVASCREDGVRIAFHVYNRRENAAAILDVSEENLDLVVRASASI